MGVEFTVERHRRQLARIVAALFAMIGLAEGGSVARLSPLVYRRALRVLRPAESAVRRLIVVLAHGLALAPSHARARTKARAAVSRKLRCASFRLFDPRPRFSSAFADERPRLRRCIRLAPHPGPRIRLIDASFDPRVPLFRQALPVAAEPVPAPPEEGTVSAARLCRRLAALKSALDDLPRQAKRYARWQARPANARRPRLSSALRPGAPPGHRKTARHKVDEILQACDWLARHPPEPDTS
jgi:hypothetical protein